MQKTKTTRRGFLRASAGLIGGGWLAANWPGIAAAAEAAASARDAGAEFSHLDPLDAADLEAMAALIIPDDDSPGAREAGVIYFMDTALGSIFAAQAAGLATGLADLNAKVVALDAGAKRFAGLDSARQIELLRREESSPIFGGVRFMTLCGFLAMPSYGGNRNHVGWDLIGFDHRHAWQPPFGYYDAKAAGNGDTDV
ncbi:MAG: gluconate 2-dehydrogenase subunit 3 family protein [Chromatiales bacterium]|nr:gluconate 2-dehydrogenase subunit 3 family protein [Chromatiales bacterium]MDH3893009.1 gluconate 2-dehydrogenase subunit 3 family protein [Chromatiales bacterium]MDH3931051.1 gluconate 2-dehydrogenase subunit 3 family protein [Chromatiales bacterium]MDH3945540.1 gluconate 2-dehydrogenase subunit 3 family protein [Chromatiales bacterium]MDH4014447.1 gluconate 2-dehydrogenase subunit 3 family protein [Chromatiales bacterium]